MLEYVSPISKNSDLDISLMLIVLLRESIFEVILTEPIGIVFVRTKTPHPEWLKDVLSLNTATVNENIVIIAVNRLK